MIYLRLAVSPYTTMNHRNLCPEPEAVRSPRMTVHAFSIHAVLLHESYQT